MIIWSSAWLFNSKLAFGVSQGQNIKCLLLSCVLKASSTVGGVALGKLLTSWEMINPPPPKQKQVTFSVSVLMFIYLSMSLSLCLYVCLYYSLLTSISSLSLLCLLLSLPSCWSLLGTNSHRGFMYLISMAYLDLLSDNIQCARLDNF